MCGCGGGGKSQDGRRFSAGLAQQVWSQGSKCIFELGILKTSAAQSYAGKSTCLALKRSQVSLVNCSQVEGDVKGLNQEAE